MSSLAWIGVGFINYLMESESPSLTLKRFILLCFLNLNLFGVLAFCFTWRGRSSNSFAVRFAPLFHVESSLNKPLCGSLRFRVSVLQNDSTAHSLRLFAGPPNNSKEAHLDSYVALDDSIEPFLWYLGSLYAYL